MANSDSINILLTGAQPQPSIPPPSDHIDMMTADTTRNTSWDVATTLCPPLSSDLGSTIEDHSNGPEGSGRPVQSRRLPTRFKDVLPEPPLPSSHSPSIPSGSSSQVLPHVILHVFDSFRTSFNKFSIARDYCHRPSYDPDSILMLDQLSNTQPMIDLLSTVPLHISSPPPPPWPWKNMSVWHLMTWMMTGSTQKSSAEVTHLVHEVICSPDFDLNDLDGFNARTQMRQFNKSKNVPSDDIGSLRQDSWKESTITILVPTRERNPARNGQPFVIPGLSHCSLTAIICAAFSKKAAKWFHLTPFKRIWKSPISGQEQHIFDELYMSDAWITVHDQLQKQRRNDECNLERVIAALMFWSDAMKR